MNDVQQSEHGQRVAWFELFYDLIVVAAVGQSSKIFGSEPTWATTAWIGLALLTLFSIWLLTTVSNNLSNRNDPVRWIITLVQMVAIITAALAMGRDGGLHDDWGFLSLAVAFATVAALYLRVARQEPGYRWTSRVVATSTLIGALIMLVGMWVAEHPIIGPINLTSLVFAVGLAVALLPFYTIVLTRAVRANALEEEHLGERFGLLVIIVLGESFIGLVAELGKKSSIPNPVFFALTLLVVFAIWVIYFWSVAPGGVPETAGRVRAWMVLHILLMWSAVGAATGLSALVLVPFISDEASEERTWTSTPLFGVMLALLLLTLLNRRRARGAMTVHAIACALLFLLSFTGVAILGKDAFFTMAAGAIVIIGDALVFGLLLRRESSVGIGATSG